MKLFGARPFKAQEMTKKDVHKIRAQLIGLVAKTLMDKSCPVEGYRKAAAKRITSAFSGQQVRFLKKIA